MVEYFLGAMIVVSFFIAIGLVIWAYDRWKLSNVFIWTAIIIILIFLWTFVPWAIGYAILNN